MRRRLRRRGARSVEDRRFQAHLDALEKAGIIRAVWNEEENEFVYYPVKPPS